MCALFSRIPSAVWFGIFALAVAVLPGAVWTVLLSINLVTSPAIPWAVIAMAILLWILWQYLAGKWWPRGTSETRHRLLRANIVSRNVFVSALVAGGLSIFAFTGAWIVLFQLVKVPGNVLPAFSAYPLVTVLLVAIMASVIAGVSEEAGIRGYLQSILEGKVSVPVAILIPALVLAPAHAVTQGFVLPTMLFYLFVDVSYGVTAYLTQSILPGMVIHALGILIFFTTVWPYDPMRHLVSEGGADTWFWIHLAQAVLFTILTFLAFRRLAKVAALMNINKQTDQV